MVSSCSCDAGTEVWEGQLVCAECGWVLETVTDDCVAGTQRVLDERGWHLVEERVREMGAALRLDDDSVQMASALVKSALGTPPDRKGGAALEEHAPCCLLLASRRCRSASVLTLRDVVLHSRIPPLRVTRCWLRLLGKLAAEQQRLDSASPSSSADGSTERRSFALDTRALLERDCDTLHRAAEVAELGGYAGTMAPRGPGRLLAGRLLELASAEWLLEGRQPETSCGAVALVALGAAAPSKPSGRGEGGEGRLIAAVCSALRLSQTQVKLRAAELRSVAVSLARSLPGRARLSEREVLRSLSSALDEASLQRAAAAAEASGEGGGGGDGGGDGAEVGEARMVLESRPLVRGTEVRLDGLELGGECVARLTHLWADLGCVRCGERAQLRLSGLSATACSSKVWCDKCSAVLAATLRPAFLGSAAGLSAAAFLDTAGCTLADVPRFGLLLMCACGAEREVSDPARGRRVRDGCRECHSPQPLYFSNVTLVRHAGAAGGGGGGGGRGGGEEEEEDEMESLLKKLRKKNASQLASLGLSVGKPLPNKGACKHFKHSYRWLRFPCCGRAHPCATCHAASDCPAAAAGQAVWATRMLCGKCSREMPYSDRPCSSCGNTFTRPGGGHWQGGDGCRDQTRLAKSDSRKHKGTSAAGAKKTVSAKSQRVGAAGSRATAAKKLAMARPA